MFRFFSFSKTFSSGNVDSNGVKHPTLMSESVSQHLESTGLNPS
jgi:hypothetical protein